MAMTNWTSLHFIEILTNHENRHPLCISLHMIGYRVYTENTITCKNLVESCQLDRILVKWRRLQYSLDVGQKQTEWLRSMLVNLRRVNA